METITAGGAADIFERGGVSLQRRSRLAEDTVHDLHAKIGELAVATDFMSRRLKRWVGK